MQLAIPYYSYSITLSQFRISQRFGYFHVVLFRSVQDPALLNVLVEKSPTFLISCVCYIDELSKVRGAECLKNSDHVKAIISFLQVLAT